MDLGNVHTPQRFGRYILLDRMGAGGMAEVFRAVMPGAEGFRRDLVIKRILSEQSLAPKFIEMFGHEARISALLHHPNIVQVFDFGLVEGSYFLAMELLRGRDLLRLMRSLRERDRMLPIPIAAHIAHQVARGLGHAHALTSPDGQPLNIVHRDVSPSNIMCLRAGGVKLLDFGIASALGEVDAAENSGRTFKGKIPYMAPERLLNQPCDGRIDLFALGTVLWEMLTGRRLFHGKNDGERALALLERPIPPPSSLRSDVPLRLDEIVLKALERNPEQRYAPGHALADDLEQVVLDTKFASRMLPALLNELFGTAPSASHVALSSLPPELFALDPTPAESGSGGGGGGRLTGGGTTPAPHAEVPGDNAAGSIEVGRGGEPPAIDLEPTEPTPVPPRSRPRGRTLAAAVAGTVLGLGLAVFVMRPGSNARSSWMSAGTQAVSASKAEGQTPRQVHGAVTESLQPQHPAVATPSPDPGFAATPAPSPPRNLAGRAVVQPAAPAHGVQTPRPTPARARGGLPATASSRPHRGGGRTGAERIAKGLSIDPFAEAAARSGDR